MSCHNSKLASPSARCEASGKVTASSMHQMSTSSVSELTNAFGMVPYISCMHLIVGVQVQQMMPRCWQHNNDASNDTRMLSESTQQLQLML